MIKRTDPANKIRLCYKTTSTSDIITIVISHEQGKGLRPWWHKGDQFASMCNQFVNVESVPIPEVKEAMKNMTSALRRDPEAGPDMVMNREVKEKIKDDKGKDSWVGKGIYFPEIVAKTYITIPYAKLQTVEEESKWAEDTVQLIGDTLLDIQHKSIVWKEVYELTCVSSNVLEKSKQQIPTFWQQCGVVIEKCTNFNRLIIR